MVKELNVLVDEITLKSKIKAIANLINIDYKDEDLDIIYMLNGASFFVVELAKHLTVNTRLFPFGFNSFEISNESGEVQVTLDVPVPLFGKNVLILEGIIVSGRTPQFVYQLIKNRMPKRLDVCAIGFKPQKLVAKLPIKYFGFQFNSEIVVGFGIGHGKQKQLQCLIDITN